MYENLMPHKSYPLRDKTSHPGSFERSGLGKLSQFAGFLMATLILISGTVQGQDLYKTTVSLQSKNASLKQAFHSIESQTPFSFTYKTNDIAAYSNISYHYNEVPVGKLLDDLLRNTGLNYEVVNNNIIIKRASSGEEEKESTSAAVDGGIK